MRKQVRQRPAEAIELDTGPDEAPARQVILVELHRAALRVEHLQRESPVTCRLARHHAQHELAIAHHALHAGGLDRPPGEPTGHITVHAPPPGIECRLDRLVGQRVEPALVVAALRLQHHPLRPDDVLSAHPDERLGVIVACGLLAAAGHQHPLVALDHLVGRHRVRGPVQRQPVAAGGIEQPQRCPPQRRMSCGRQTPCRTCLSRRHGRQLRRRRLPLAAEDVPQPHQRNATLTVRPNRSPRRTACIRASSAL